LLTGALIMGAEALLAKTPGDSNVPIQQFCGDDRPAPAALLDQHRERLRRLVELRLDPRTRARLDASDLVQDTFLDVAQEHNERPRVVDAFFALARRRRGKPPGTGSMGITG
jgi:hypothetical protein